MTDTETKIKTAIKDLILKEGKFEVTVQEIAEKSEISRSVVHYYFRSKGKLLSFITEHIFNDLVFPAQHLLFTEDSLKNKVENYLESCEKSALLYPYLNTYIMYLYTKNDFLKNQITKVRDSFNYLINQIKECILRQETAYRNPAYFLLDLFSLSGNISNTSILIDNHIFSNDMIANVSEDRKKRILKILFV